MVKFLIIFYQPDDLAAFETRYNAFLALIERMPNISRRQVVNVLGGPTGESRYYRFLEVYFDDENTMRAALTSSEGQVAGAAVGKFPQGSVEMAFADVFEEAGGKTE
jgi:uncharacterized protein (TIGR02118 family)